jgi:hypothetical protein
MLEGKEKINESLKIIGAYIKEALIVELALQGHNATGTLINSITTNVLSTPNASILFGEFVYYGRFVDTGRRAGARRVPIDALIKWIKQKGFESVAKKIRGMAFAIQKTIFEKGISTAQSWKGEATKDFMTKTLKNLEPQITNDIEKAAEQSIEAIIDNMIRETRSFATKYGFAA